MCKTILKSLLMPSLFSTKNTSHMTKFILPFWVIMHPNQDQIPGIQFLFFFNFFLLLFFLLYNIVLVLPYINMHPPRVYPCSPSGTPLPPPSPYHPSGSSQCTSPKLPVSCIEPAWTGDSFLIWYYTCFNAILLNHPPFPLPQSPKDCSIHLCFFCCLAYRVVITIFLNSIYMHSYTVLVFFFLAYFTLYNRLQFHPSH